MYPITSPSSFSTSITWAILLPFVGVRSSFHIRWKVGVHFCVAAFSLFMLFGAFAFYICTAFHLDVAWIGGTIGDPFAGDLVPAFHLAIGVVPRQGMIWWPYSPLPLDYFCFGLLAQGGGKHAFARFCGGLGVTGS